MKHFQHLEASLKSMQRQQLLHQVSLTKNHPKDKYYRRTESPKPRDTYDSYIHNCNNNNLSSNNYHPHHNNNNNNNNNGDHDEQCAAITVNATSKRLQKLFLYTIAVLVLYVLFAIAKHNYTNFVTSGDESQRQVHIVEERSSSSSNIGFDINAPTSSLSLSQSSLVDASTLDARLNQLERYIEILALNLHSAELRLSEREKCECQKSCTFNGTRFTDGSKWQSAQCEQCECKFGTIQCSPLKCAPVLCDKNETIIPIGKCCPVCMKKCKYQNAIYKHGQMFAPSHKKASECKCLDGRIKCEQKQTQQKLSIQDTLLSRPQSKQQPQMLSITSERF